MKGILAPVLGPVLAPVLDPILAPVAHALTAPAPPRESVTAHVIWGQSNGTTNGGTAGTTPNAPQGEFYDPATDTWTSMADGPTSPAAATLAPALVNEWYVQTGKRSVVLNTAIGSTRMLDYGDPDATWAPTGNLRAPMFAKVQEFVAAIAARGYRLEALYVHAVGPAEGDAENLDGSHTAAMYTAGLIEFAEDLKEAVPELTQVVILRVGANASDRTKDAGYFAIRVAQQDAADDSDLITMGYPGTSSFRSMGLLNDAVHYNQDGKNLAGKCQAIATHAPYEMLGAPTVLDTFTIPADTDYSTTASSRSDNITVPAGTESIRYMPTASRPGSTATFLFNPPTFDGVAFTVNRQQADNGSTPRCVAGVYELDLATYMAAKGGASWDNVTAALVTSTSGDGAGGSPVACNFINGGGVFLDAVVRDWHDLMTLTGTTTGTNVVAQYMIGAAAVTVVSASSTAASAAQLTSTMAGATQLLNTGGSNGTRSGQNAIGYQVDSEQHDVTSTGPTFSGTCDAIAQVVASYRLPYPGEV